MQNVGIAQKNPLNNDNPLGYEKIPKLIMKYAVPSVISMLITAFYNIVDQIFIGRGVGYIGNTATNIAFPFVTFCLAIALLIGNGFSSYMNLRLGEGRRSEASRAFGSSILLATICGFVLSLIGFIFLNPLLYSFGATQNSFSYAYDYTSLLMIGLPFQTMTITMNNAIRADGSPRYSMISISSGSILNIVLDWLFVLGFGWGVKGAAVATVIGQLLSFVLTMLYIRRFKNIDVKKEYFTLKNKALFQTIGLGFSSFVIQFASVIVQVINNNVLKQYGIMSVYGADIPIAALGITMKVNMILISCLLGIAIGQQPIIGFNYGAGKYDRMLKAYFLATLIATGVAFAGWAVLMTCTQSIINIFGQEEALYNTFANLCIKRYLALVFTAGFGITTPHMFQAIGKPVISIIITLLRQIVILAPLAIILPKYLGIEGILYSCPITDFVTLIVSAVFVIIEVKKIKELMKKQNMHNQSDPIDAL